MFTDVFLRNPVTSVYLCHHPSTPQDRGGVQTSLYDLLALQPWESY